MSDNESLPTEYDALDGLGDNLIDQCPHCDEDLHPRHYSGPVYDSDGTEYEHITTTDPEDRPFFCENCWPELVANQKRAENQQLTEYE